MYQNIKLQLPPGLARTETEYRVQGRYYDADLWRWHQGSEGAIGGWRRLGSSTVTGKARNIVTWVDNTNQIWAAIGTHSKLYAMTRSGVISDITPTTFTAGRESAEFGGGYGSGAYGAGTYGTPREDVNVVNPAGIWSLDVFGQYLVGVMPDDGNIVRWQLNTGTPAATISGAPTGRAVLATNDRFLMVLGAGNDPRKVQWSDRADETTWTPASTNLSGDAILQTNGTLLAGRRYQGGELIFTTTDVHQARYVGSPSVYLFEQLATGCGLVSSQAVASVGPRVFWMSANSFWMFNGIAQPMQCDVQDYVFANMNESQISKVSAVHNQKFGEIWWFYPSKTSMECDSYVFYNYLEDHWNFGTLDRTCGTRSGAFANVLMVASSGEIYEHEIGQNRDGRQARARAAPIEMGSGERFMYAKQYIPDDGTQGDVSVRFYSRLYPNSTETVHGPYTAASLTDTRFSGRQIAWEYLVDSGQSGRIGVNRIVAKAGGRR